VYFKFVIRAVRDRTVVVYIIEGFVMNFRGSKGDSTRGFTLVELLVTIAVFAIIASIAAPSITNALANRRMKTAAYELKSSIIQARALAATYNRNVEMWPAYISGNNTTWNVPKANRTSINLPNTSDASKTSLSNAKLSWYVVAPGAASGTAAVAIADSTSNLYPVQVSLPDQTLIKVGSLPATIPSAASGIRFSPSGYIGNIPTSSLTTSTTFTQVTFRVCDSGLTKPAGYTVIVSAFGAVRVIAGPSPDTTDTVGSASC
jgi:prepilin-type N-terminal cleavage/methylation domain-containing protein